MDYRNNNVSIVSKTSGFDISNGQYEVKDFSITDGQDPNNHIFDGYVASFGNDGEMIFSIGRKGSSDVAKWFNGKFKSDETTFDHSADQLNFAFKGTLTINDSKGNTYTFEDVGLAQGHTGSSNNWWFASTNGKYNKDHTMQVLGQDQNGNTITFDFLRGGNSVSEVQITST